MYRARNALSCLLVLLSTPLAPAWAETAYRQNDATVLIRLLVSKYGPCQTKAFEARAGAPEGIEVALDATSFIVRRTDLGACGRALVGSRVTVLLKPVSQEAQRVQLHFVAVGSAHPQTETYVNSRIFDVKEVSEDHGDPPLIQ